MKTLFLTLMALVLACGQQSSNDEKESKENFDSGGGIDREPEEKEIVTEYKKSGDKHAIALATTKELPECDLGNENQLAYIKDDDKFLTCYDGVWTEIDIEGAEGPKGDKGDPGEAIVLSQNQWVDPITKRVWLIGANVTYSQALASCTGDYAIPTYDELHVAVLHGLGVASAAIDGSDNGWTNETMPANPSAVRVITFNPLNDGYFQLTESHGVMCIKK